MHDQGKGKLTSAKPEPCGREMLEWRRYVALKARRWPRSSRCWGPGSCRNGGMLGDTGNAKAARCASVRGIGLGRPMAAALLIRDGKLDGLINVDDGIGFTPLMYAIQESRRDSFPNTDPDPHGLQEASIKSEADCNVTNRSYDPVLVSIRKRQASRRPGTARSPAEPSGRRDRRLLREQANPTAVGGANRPTTTTDARKPIHHRMVEPASLAGQRRGKVRQPSRSFHRQ